MKPGIRPVRAAWVYAFNGCRTLLNGQCRYFLGLGDGELSLFYVAQDLRCVLLNFLRVGYVVEPEKGWESNVGGGYKGK